MNGAGHNSPARTVSWARAGALLAALLVWSRYLTGFPAGFLLDDWSFMVRATPFGGVGDILAFGLLDRFRPCNLTVTLLCHHLFGLRPGLYDAFGFLSYAALLGAGLALCRSSRCNATGWIWWALPWLLWPGLVESFSWKNHAILAYAYVASVLSVVLLLRAASPAGRPAWGAASTVAFLVALGSYEFNVALFPVFLCVAATAPAGRRLRLLVPHAIALAGFLGWRFHGYGLAQDRLTSSVYFSSEGPLQNLWNNIRILIDNTVGAGFLRSFSWGLADFAGQPDRRLYPLLAGSVLLAVLLLRQMQSETAGPPAPAAGEAPSRASWLRLAALLWIVSGLAIYLRFPLSSRHLLFPLLGAGWLLAQTPWLQGLRSRVLPVVAIVLALSANQGTARGWRLGAEANERVYAELARTVGQWQSREVLLFQTDGLRSNALRNGAVPVFSSWDHRGNGGLYRGFALEGMVRLLAPKSQVKVFLDAECGARLDGNRVILHQRYDLDRVVEIPLERVWLVRLDDGGLLPAP